MRKKIGIACIIPSLAIPTIACEEIVIRLLNSHLDLDFIVFPGWTIFSLDELRVIQKRNQNNNTVCFLETWKDSDETFFHRGYAIQGNNEIINAVYYLGHIMCNIASFHDSWFFDRAEYISKDRNDIYSSRISNTWQKIRELGGISDDEEESAK